MKMRYLSAVLLAVLLAALFLRPGPGTASDPSVQGLPEGDVKKYEAMVDRALAAYNARDSKAFYKDWARMMASITTDQAFKALYVGSYMQEYGAYRSRKLVQERSAFSETNGLLSYDAQFAKKKAVLSVNFFKEGGTYKIQQIRLDPAR